MEMEAALLNALNRLNGLYDAAKQEFDTLMKKKEDDKAPEKDAPQARPPQPRMPLPPPLTLNHQNTRFTPYPYQRPFNPGPFRGNGIVRQSSSYEPHTETLPVPPTKRIPQQGTRQGQRRLGRQRRQ